MKKFRGRKRKDTRPMLLYSPQEGLERLPNREHDCKELQLEIAESNQYFSLSQRIGMVAALQSAELKGKSLDKKLKRGLGVAEELDVWALRLNQDQKKVRLLHVVSGLDVDDAIAEFSQPYTVPRRIDGLVLHEPEIIGNEVAVAVPRLQVKDKAGSDQAKAGLVIPEVEHLLGRPSDARIVVVSDLMDGVHDFAFRSGQAAPLK